MGVDGGKTLILSRGRGLANYHPGSIAISHAVLPQSETPWEKGGKLITDDQGVGVS